MDEDRFNIAVRQFLKVVGAGSQNFGERIIDFVFLPERYHSILVYGVTLLLGGSGGLVTNPVHAVTQFAA
jgi:hypothetical protein